MKKIKKGSLFTLLLRNYIIFTIIVIIIFIVSILLSYFGNQINLADYSQILEYKTLLESERYDEFPTLRLLGENSSIVIVNEDNNVVYNSGNHNISLTHEDTSYIPDAISDYSIDSKILKTYDQKINYEISITSDDGNQDILILDDTFKIIYGTKDLVGNQLTKKQYQLLTNQYYQDYLVYKFSFSTKTGNQNTMLLFRYANQDFVELQKIGKMFTQCFFYFTLFYILLIFIFIIWLKEKINKPLKLLCNIFENYRVGQLVEQKYNGPKEFMNIFDHFSLMVNRLNESEKQKKKIEENKNQMIANIVHDFKTPIAVIKGYTQAIEDGVIPYNEQKQYLSIINNKSTQLNELILNLYEYSKMDHPHFQLHLEKQDICVYFRNFVAEWYSELELSGFQLEVDIPDSHIILSFDPSQLKRVFANIIGNTINHTEKGTTIYFGLDIRENEIILLLGDNGEGISPEFAENIFEPFVIGNRSRNDSGSGLGLSIAKKIVEMHNGSLQLISHSKWKTLFQIKLPRI